MKHSEMTEIKTHKNTRFSVAAILILATPLLLIIPNIILDITESYLTPVARVLNIILPLSGYTLLISAFRNPAKGVLWSLLFMILAAFEIVLLFLYGGSVIAVDMFLNVFTTSFSEATELLACLTTAILTVCVLYLPPLVSAIVLVSRRCRQVSDGLRRMVMHYSLYTFGASVMTTGICAAMDGRFVVTRDIFPLSALSNICEAVNRVRALSNYADTSAGFTYDARPTHDPDSREVYVLVIGETSRADNWQLGGYERETNPRLSRRDDVVFFEHALSQSNTTHKSVPMLMSAVTAHDYDSINCHKSVITAFKEAGFHTLFFSNQPPNHSYNQFFGEEADECVYLDGNGVRHPYDGEVLPLIGTKLADDGHNKLLIVIHTYGSHFKYSDRYPDGYARFTPDQPCIAESSNREVLLNAYDNSIIYTDALLDDLICQIEACGCRGALIYAADHGEDIFDDDRGRFLHASPTPTYWQLHGAMLAWLSPQARAEEGEAYDRLVSRAHEYVTPSESVFHTLIDVAGIDTPLYSADKSLLSKTYHRPDAYYVTDRNEGVTLDNSGLKAADVALFKKMYIL